MGERRIPLYKAFQRLMWQEMADDNQWAATMDEEVHKLPPGESWPHEPGMNTSSIVD